MSPAPLRLRAALTNRLRLARARLMHKTIRFKVGDLHQFYADLARANIPYVVLRWLDEVPFDPADAAARAHDVDHLVENGYLDQIRDIASRNPGDAKCDFYSRTGERGSAYRGFPYLTPALAELVLRDRQQQSNGVYAPRRDHLFWAFCYHMVYHKGTESGIETGLDTVQTDTNPKRNYEGELRRLAADAQVQLGVNVTLLGLHRRLEVESWNMPLDLMQRWPNRHAVLKALLDRGQADMSPLIAACRDIKVFVLRSDCEGAEAQALAAKVISERFEILENRVLDSKEATDLSRLTRGGNWFEKGRDAVVAPTHALICRQAAVPGPLPKGYTAEKLAKRYPLVDHTDVLIKRDARDAVNRLLGGAATRIVVHATDNVAETAETLAAIFGDEALPHIKALSS